MLEERVRELTSDGYDACALELDTSNPASVEAAADSLDAVDILVNVAGTNVRKRFEQFTREEYDRLLETNLHGIVAADAEDRRQDDRARQGRQGDQHRQLMTLLGLPYLSVYAISKGGLGQLTKVLAAEWGRYNIQVNCIAPGFIVTDLNRDMWKQEKMVTWLRGNQANPNLGTPDDVAPLAVFLASRGSDYITGQVIAVDGGYSTTSVWPFEV